MMYFNIQSLLKHIEEIQIFLHDHKPALIFLSETCVTEDIEMQEISFDGYNTIRCDSHSRHTGGVAIIINDRLKYKIISKSTLEENVWLLTVRIISPYNATFTILYHSPSSSDSEFLEFLENWYDSNINSSEQNVIVGDFNIDMCTVSTYSTKLDKFIKEIGMKQLVNEYTRVTERSKSRIDLVISNVLNLQAKVIDFPKLSDHSNIKLNFIPTSVNCRYKYITVRDTHAYDSKNCNEILNKINWCDVSSLDINMKSDILVSELQKCVDTITPLKSIKINVNKINWYNSELKRLKKNRDLSFKRAKFKNTREEWICYRSIKNLYNAKLKETKNKYFRDHLTSVKHNPKKMWSTLKSILKCKNEILPGSMKFDSGTVNGHKDIAENLNNYFVESIVEINKNIVISENDTFCDKFQEKTDKEFKFKKIDIDDLTRIIAKMKNKNCKDGITLNFIKDTLPAIGDILVNIINEALCTGVFPQSWKTATISPIPKITGTDKSNEFRPINMLPTYEKILENVVKEQLMDYLELNGLLLQEQSGFRDKHSCETALNLVISKWKKEIENNNITVAVFLDLKRAFETIDRNRLLRKLETFGIKNVANDFFRSYLEGRKQFTVYGEETSSARTCPIGVPQGSILGPLLFILYMDDIATVLSLCSVNLFADDTLVWFSHKNLNMAINVLNSELNRLSSWFKVNKLKLNTVKSKTMIISTKCINENIDMVQLDNNVIEYVDHMKYLGVIIDGNLKFNYFVDHVIKKLGKKIGFFSRVSKRLDIWTKIIVYKSIIAPHFDYCSTILFLCTENDIQRLQKMQNKAMRVILYCDKRTHIRTMLDALQWMSVKQRIYLHSMIFIYKLVNNMLPNYLNEGLILSSEMHNYNNRDKTNFRLPLLKKTCSQNCLYYKGIKFFNELPLEIKKSNSIKTFRKRCADFIKSVIQL